MKKKFKSPEKVKFAWAFYDWANSVYSLVISTAIFPIYYESVTAGEHTDQIEFLGRTFTNTALYAYTMSLSFFLVAILSPLLSSIADASGKKKSFMKFFCYLGAASCAALFFFEGPNLWLGLGASLFASIGFSGSLVFYNAFLPEIAPFEEQDSLSAKGFSLGYLGGTLLMVLNLLMIQKPEWFGMSPDPEDIKWMTRCVFLTVAVWWFLFSQYTFKYLPDNVYNLKAPKRYLFKGYKELGKVWKSLSEAPRIKRFLFAFFFYSVGVQTVILLATLFGKKVLHLESSELIITILLIQVVAIGGSLLFSSLSRKMGNIKAIQLAIFIWILICFAAYFTQSSTQFYGIAAGVGMVLGGIQALSRSTFSKILPQTTNHATYFSFFDVTEKVSVMVGTLVFGLLEEISNNMRYSILALGIFFVVGYIILYKFERIKAPKETIAD